MDHHSCLRWSIPALSLLLSACTVNATATLPGQSSVPSGSTAPNAQAPTAPNSATGEQPVPGNATPVTPATSTEGGAELREVEPNNDFDAANALPLGQWLMGTAGKNEGGDYFKVNTPEGKQAGLLDVTIEENHDRHAPWFKIYSSSKKSLLNKYATNTETPFSVQIRANAGALYYINLNDGEGNPYKLKADFTPVLDPYEPNEDYDQATALALDTSVQFASFHADDAEKDVDMFRCKLPEDKSTLRIKITNKTTAKEPGYYWVKVFDSSKKQFFNKYGSNREDLDYKVPGQAGQEYFISITGGSNTSALSDLIVTAE